MDYKNVISFVVGAAVGSVVTYFVMRKREDEEEFEDCKDDDEDSGEVDDIYSPRDVEIAKAVIKDNETRKAELFSTFFSNTEEAIEELKEVEDKNMTVSTTGEPIPSPEVISPEQFFDEEFDYDGEEIVKAEDPLIYFMEDGILINTEDTEPYEPVSEETCEEYLELDRAVEHFGEYGEEDVLYLRCFEKPVTDYKIVCEHSTFKESRWYSGEAE